jgi:hypothetical protein
MEIPHAKLLTFAAAFSVNPPVSARAYMAHSSRPGQWRGQPGAMSADAVPAFAGATWDRLIALPPC